MQIKFFLFIFSFASLSISAQKQVYFLFAATQKNINIVCGAKELLNNAEVTLTKEEALTYERDYLATLNKKYNTQSNYRNNQVKLIKSTQVVICYQAEKIYYPKTDGWDCTSSYYGCIIANDLLTAENKFAAMKLEYKQTVFKEIKRWGNPIMQSIKEEDLEIRWVKTTNGIGAFFKNTKKDMALVIQIKSLKQPASGKINMQLEGGFEKLTAVEENTVVIQPGGSAQISLKNADAFEIETSTEKETKDEEGAIKQVKQLIKRYMVEPGSGRVNSCCGGVRG